MAMETLGKEQNQDYHGMSSKEDPKRVKFLGLHDTSPTGKGLLWKSMTRSRGTDLELGQWLSLGVDTRGMNGQFG